MALRSSDSAIEEVKARTDLGELVASYGIALHHAGSQLKACCPFHREKTPSFFITPSRGTYKCFGCGEHGDALSFVMKMEGLTFPEALKRLAARCGVELKEQADDPSAGRRKRLYALMLELAQFYRRCLLQIKDAELAREYLRKRELDGKAQEEFMIGYAPQGAPVMLKWAEKNGYTLDEMVAAGVMKAPSRPGDAGYHRFSGRLMFPIRDRQGRVVAFSGRQLIEDKRSGKYVNSPETEIFRKSNVLYCFDRAAGNIARAPHREVIVCEGQIDCIRLHVSGFPMAVASQGTAFTEEHVKMLSRVADAAALVFDDDAAGHKAAIRASGMLLAANIPVRAVRLPDGDDPDSFLRQNGSQAFQKLLDDAESVVGFQCRVERAKETHPDSLDAVSRVTKAVLGTIAQCPNAVLRASMVGEASRLLSLPAAALNDELQKLKPATGTAALAVPKPAVQAAAPAAAGATAEPLPDELPDEYDNDVFDEEFQPREAAEAPPRIVIPPPAREISFVAFLLAHEDDKRLDAMIGDLLPPEVFMHDFTRDFIAAWREQTASGEDRLGTFVDALQVDERVFFDQALRESDRALAGSRDPCEVMQEFIRALWVAQVERMRGEMPASDTSTAMVARRLGLTTAIKRLRFSPWDAIPEIVATLVQQKFPNSPP